MVGCQYVAWRALNVETERATRLPAALRGGETNHPRLGS